MKCCWNARVILEADDHRRSVAKHRLRGRRPRGARGAHGAPGRGRSAASMTPDAHVRRTSPPHSVPSPGAVLCSMAYNPGYLNDAACAVRAVRGRHPHEQPLRSASHDTDSRRCTQGRAPRVCHRQNQHQHRHPQVLLVPRCGWRVSSVCCGCIRKPFRCFTGALFFDTRASVGQRSRCRDHRSPRHLYIDACWRCHKCFFGAFFVGQGSGMPCTPHLDTCVPDFPRAPASSDVI